MKKFAFALLALGLAAQASAGTFDTGARTVVEPGTGDDQCALLSEGVTATLSANVAGAFACDTDTNLIAITTCHPNGRKDAEGNNNFYTANGAGGGVANERSAACTADAAETIADAAAAVEVEGPEETPETPVTEP